MMYTESYVIDQKFEDGIWYTVWESRDDATEFTALETLKGLSNGQSGTWRVIRRMEVVVATYSRARM